MEWWQDVTVSPLNWYRSWPEVVPEGRAYVQDSLPKLLMHDCDYRTMEWPADEPGICLLEWDIALDQRERNLFAEQALSEPNKVLVAPYWKSYGGALRHIHRKLDNEPTEVGSPDTDLFGFGCIYIPGRMVTAFLASPGYRNSAFTDTTFSRWHRREHGRARIAWDVHPQHLHGD